MNDFQINSLAEQIMNSGAISIKKQTPAVFESKDSAPDISDIAVPEDYVQSILGVKKEKLVEEKSSTDVVTEARVVSLISELSQVIKKAKGLIEELTTCGMLGTSGGKSSKKKVAKYGYTKFSKTSK